MLIETANTLFWQKIFYLRRSTCVPRLFLRKNGVTFLVNGIYFGFGVKKRVFWQGRRCDRREKTCWGKIKAAQEEQDFKDKTAMQSITINISNDNLAEKVTWLLEHFKHDGLEIVSREDMDDLRLLKATRKEKSVALDDCLKNEG